MPRKGRIGIALILCALLYGARASSADVDPSIRDLQPPTSDSPSDDGAPTVLRDMGVVQRKAMPKANRFLMSDYLSMDFSDGPYSMYGVNVNLGYALSDFWEVYVNTVPYFINSKRSIVDKVSQLTLQGGQQASLTSSLARRQYGVEVLWAPFYGKDSLGVSTVIRSDTFFKLGAATIDYDVGNGMRFQAGVGKTYFLGRSAGLRFAVTGDYTQTIVDQVKAFHTLLMLETGLVFYL